MGRGRRPRRQDRPSKTTLQFLIASPGLSSGGIVLPSRSSAGRNVDVYEVQNAPCETCAVDEATNVRCSLRPEAGKESAAGCLRNVSSRSDLPLLVALRLWHLGQAINLVVALLEDALVALLLGLLTSRALRHPPCLAVAGRPLRARRSGSRLGRDRWWSRRRSWRGTGEQRLVGEHQVLAGRHMDQLFASDTREQGGRRTRTAATIFSSAFRLRSSLSSLPASTSVASFLTPPLSVAPFSAGADASGGVADGRYCLRSATMTLALEVRRRVDGGVGGKARQTTRRAVGCQHSRSRASVTQGKCRTDENARKGLERCWSSDGSLCQEPEQGCLDGSARRDGSARMAAATTHRDQRAHSGRIARRILDLISTTEQAGQTRAYDRARSSGEREEGRRTSRWRSWTQASPSGLSAAGRHAMARLGRSSSVESEAIGCESGLEELLLLLLLAWYGWAEAARRESRVEEGSTVLGPCRRVVVFARRRRRW